MTRMQNENLNDNSYTANEQLKPNKSWEHKLPPKSIYEKQQKAGLIIL